MTRSHASVFSLCLFPHQRCLHGEMREKWLLLVLGVSTNMRWEKDVGKHQPESSNSDTRLRSFIKAMSPEEPLLRTIWILYFNPEYYYSRVFVTDSWLFPIIRSISTNGCTVWLWGRYVLVLYRKSTKFYEKEKTSQSGSKKWNITLTWFSRTQVPACFIIPLF